MAKKLVPVNRTRIPQPIRHLAGGGLLSAIGDAVYQYVPPVSIPNIGVRKAAPVDAMSAYNAANAAGLAAGSKLADTFKTSMKESLEDAEMTPFDRANIEKNHSILMQDLSQKLTADPAYFASEANRVKFGEQARAILKPEELTRARNTYKQWGQDEEGVGTDRMNNVAFYQGRAMDDTYGGTFARFRQEVDPSKMYDLFAPRIVGRDGEGRPKFGSNEPMRLDLPSGNVNDAMAELKTLEDKIKPWTTEGGDTQFATGVVDPNLKKLYQDLGGDATGTETITNKNSEETNLDIIKAIGARMQGKTFWRRLMTAQSAQALYADEYRKVAIDTPEPVGQILGLKESALQLSTGKLNLNGNHLEVRRALREAAYESKNQKDRDLISDAYLKIREYDDNQTEENIKDRMVKRLNLQKYYSSSNVTTRSRTDQGLLPPKDPSEGNGSGIALLGGLQFGGAEVNGSTVLTDYAPTDFDANGLPKLGKGMPIWGYSVAGNQDVKDVATRISTGQSLADIIGGGMGVYNASTLAGIGSPSTDSRTQHASLQKTKVVPGGGQVVMLPADPKDMKLKRAQLDRLTASAQQLQNLMAPLKRKLEGNTITPNEKMQLEGLQQRQQQEFSIAREQGIVPAMRFNAIVEKNDVRSKDNPFIKSAGNPTKAYDAVSSSWWTPTGSDNKDSGLGPVSEADAKAAGLDTEVWRSDVFLSYPVYITIPNLHMSGSEATQKQNGSINAKVQQQNAATQRQGTINNYIEQ